MSEWELQERREREEGREAEAQALGAEGDLGGAVVPTHHRVHGIGRGGMRSGSAFSFVISLVRIISSWDRPGRRAKGVLATSRHRADSGRENRTKYTLP